MHLCCSPGMTSGHDGIAALALIGRIVPLPLPECGLHSAAKKRLWSKVCMLLLPSASSSRCRHRQCNQPVYCLMPLAYHWHLARMQAWACNSVCSAFLAYCIFSLLARVLCFMLGLIAWRYRCAAKEVCRMSCEGMHCEGGALSAYALWCAGKSKQGGCTISRYAG